MLFARSALSGAAQREAGFEYSHAREEAGLGAQIKNQGKFQRKGAEIEDKNRGRRNIYDQDCAPPGEL